MSNNISILSADGTVSAMDRVAAQAMVDADSVPWLYLSPSEDLSGRGECIGRLTPELVARVAPTLEVDFAARTFRTPVITSNYPYDGGWEIDRRTGEIVDGCTVQNMTLPYVVDRLVSVGFVGNAVRLVTYSQWCPSKRESARTIVAPTREACFHAARRVVDADRARVENNRGEELVA
jgi:hypothetical protein